MKAYRGIMNTVPGSVEVLQFTVIESGKADGKISMITEEESPDTGKKVEHKIYPEFIGKVILTKSAEDTSPIISKCLLICDDKVSHDEAKVMICNALNGYYTGLIELLAAAAKYEPEQVYISKATPANNG